MPVSKIKRESGRDAMIGRLLSGAPSEPDEVVGDPAPEEATPEVVMSDTGATGSGESDPSTGATDEVTPGSPAVEGPAVVAGAEPPLPSTDAPADTSPAPETAVASEQVLAREAPPTQDSPGVSVVAAAAPAPAQAAAERAKALRATIGFDPRLTVPDTKPVKKGSEEQLANRIPSDLKARVKRHSQRTGETINSLLSRMLDVAMEIHEAEAGVDKDGRPL